MGRPGKAASDKIELKDNGNNAFQLIFSFDVPAALPDGAKALPETGDFQALTAANFGANWPFGADLPFTASIKSAVNDDVPEPSALLTLFSGLLGLALVAWGRRALRIADSHR